MCNSRLCLIALAYVAVVVPSTYIYIVSHNEDIEEDFGGNTNWERLENVLDIVNVVLHSYLIQFQV